MGTFAYYEGEMSIPEEKREIFANQMLRILNFGGMLQFEKVSIYGKEIWLIKPPEPDQDGEVEFHYNYFEDDPWESGRFNTKTLRFGSGKIGEYEFNWAIRAAYSLYEVYDEDGGIVTINGEAINTGECLGWINDILGTQFTIQNRYRLWQYFETKGLADYKDGYECNIKMLDVINSVPSIFFKGLGGIDLADICNILEGTSPLEEETLMRGSYPDVLLKVKKALRKYYNSDEDNEEKEKRIFELLKMEKEKRITIKDAKLAELATLSLNVPARAFVYLSAELLGKNFWELWSNMVTDIYHDEECREYATKELCKEREKIRNSVMPNVTTEEYFFNDGYFVFYNSPKELAKKPKYYITKDERAYWWNGEEDYFSDEMKKWLGELATRHKKIVENLGLSKLKKEDFLKKMIEILYEVNSFYKRIFAYRDMFYEFLLYSDDVNVQAAIILLKELSDENKAEGMFIKNVECRWESVSRKVTFNIGRLRMKRYLSVMANKKLREIYFEF